MKKILATILAATMVISMAACGGRNNETTENTESTVVTTETATTETVETETVETETTTTETEGAAEEGTLGTTLAAAFQEMIAANPEMTAQEIADTILSNEAIQFGPATMPVEAGFLQGFDADITGFKEGVMFSPMIGAIPFIGYVFILEEGADVEAFTKTLTDNANQRWLICDEAEETIVEASGNTVFFLMCKKSVEQ